MAGTLIDKLTDAIECTKQGCTKLEPRKIRYIVVKLERRGGKTFGLASWTTATLASGEPNFAALYIAAAGDQTDELFNDNWLGPIKGSRALSKRLENIGSRLSNKKTGSFIEIAPTSFRSITGRGKTLVIIDECRDIEARVAAALMPSIWAEHGYRCPNGHTKFTGEATVPRCGVCQEQLEPWVAQAVLMSSAGILDGSSRDWFAELVEVLRKEPDPDYYLIDLDNPNPDTDVDSRDAFARVMGKIDSMRAYVSAETGTEFVRKGTDFVSSLAIKACVDSTIDLEDASMWPAVAFLDTSSTKDRTSLVVVVPDMDKLTPNEKQTPWKRTRWAHIMSWDPAIFPHHKIDEDVIEEYCARIFRGFPNLIAFDVDVRGSKVPWATAFVDRVRTKYAWGKVCKGWGWGKHERLVRDTSFSVLQAAILEARTRWPADAVQAPIIQKELNGLALKQRPDGTWEAADRDRNIRHADIVSGMAGALWRVNQILTARPKKQFSETGFKKLDQIFHGEDSEHPLMRKKF